MKSAITLIIDKCNATNTKYDLQEGFIGFQLKNKHVWHWFKHLDGTDFYFHHSYSQNTGATKRGMKQRFRVYHSINRVLGINIQEL